MTTFINDKFAVLNLAHSLLFAGFDCDDKDDFSEYLPELSDFELNIVVGVMKRIQEGRV